jgi:hypothetical protein
MPKGKPSWNKGLKGWTKGTKAGFQKGNQLGKRTAGSKHGRWKGGYKIFSGRNKKTKYRWIRIGIRKYYPEHRLIIEKFLGRKLSKKEAVHHKDGNGLNNNLSNLEVVNWKQHKRKHSGSYLYEYFKCQCGNTKHFAKSLCERCYGREYNRKRKKIKKYRVNYEKKSYFRLRTS